MLPPQLSSSLPAARRHSFPSTSSLLHQASTSILPRTSTAHTQTRRFWGWRCRSSTSPDGADWASHLDPIYHRFTRYRTLKTRAKLLEKLKRRGRFEWDVDQKPFFTPKHIRFASHWNARWQPSSDGGKQEGKKLGKEEEEEGREGGYELSQREKEWKERMECMRKRIERDPYEAVFGKRFEPFWSPLVPSWMREEMGLQGWPKARREEVLKATPAESTFDGLKKAVEASVEKRKKAQEPVSEVKATKVEPKPSTITQPYSSYTTTSWDSRTKQAKRTEWDSASGQTKRFEYDPISNRMVQVQDPKPTATADQGIVEPLGKNDNPNRPSDMRSLINTPKSEDRALQTPVKTWSPVVVGRGTPTTPPTKPALTPQSTASTTVDTPPKAAANIVDPTPATPSSSPAPPPKPAALANLPKTDLDLLTADSVRASMGKFQRKHRSKKSLSPAEKSVLEAAFDTTAERSDAEVAEILKERELARYDEKPRGAAKPAEWDQAEDAVLQERELDLLKEKKAKLLREERGLFHIERVKREVAGLDRRIEEVAGKPKAVGAGASLNDLLEEMNRGADSKPTSGHDLLAPGPTSGTPPAKLQTSLQRNRRISPTSSSSSSSASPSQMLLQPAVDRMQSAGKELEELDDAAAHESTEVIPATPQQQQKQQGGGGGSRSSAVPKDWAKQAEILQAERVKRTTAGGGKRPPFPPVKRWIDDMEARRAAFKTNAEAAGPSQAEGARRVKMEKANALLEAEVQEQKSRMQAHEIWRSDGLRGGARQDMSFLAASRSSSSPSELAKANAVLEKEVREQRERMQAFEGKYRMKMRGLREELETAYKRSAVHAEMHVERIRGLEKGNGGKNSMPAASAGPAEAKKAVVGGEEEMMRGEGDFCANVVKWADSARWYKRPAVQPESKPQPNPQEYAQSMEKEKAVQRRRDHALVSEVRGIYEKVYGVIEAGHRQPAAAAAAAVGGKEVFETKGVVEEGGDVEIGKALEGYEEKWKYGFREDGLEAEMKAREKVAREARIAREERAAHEGQAAMVTNPLVAEQPARSANVVNDAAPQPTPETSSKPAAAAAEAKHEHAPAKPAVEPTRAATIQWADPPVYKVLAYDPGNDKLSAATTTANFTGCSDEAPIPIQQALSQLYQPARFVPQFAELQGEGYQVIYGTRDLLVFKKVRSADARETKAGPQEEEEEEAAGLLVDHGLVKPKENALAEEAANFYDRYNGPAPPKEYDPTSIENGKLMPYENAMAQEAAHAYDAVRAKARASAALVNPIDGTTTLAAGPATAAAEVSTGNFASPTGFVNHDPLFPSSSSSASEEEGKVAEILGENPPTKQCEEVVDYIHYPRVRRQEAVFTGQKRRWPRERHNTRRQERKRSQRRGAGALKWALSVGVGAAALTYGIGVAAERARRRTGDKEGERWQEILEGRRGRWE